MISRGLSLQYDRVLNNLENKSHSAKDPYLPKITLINTFIELICLK